MRIKITKTVIEKMRPRQIISDAEIIGFVVRCRLSGAKSFGYRYRSRGKKKQPWITLGWWPHMTVDEARELARTYANSVEKIRITAKEAATTAAKETAKQVLKKLEGL